MFDFLILNPFPELLSFALLGATILRVVVGILFVRYGYKGLRADNSLNTALSWVQLLGGIALIIGFYTQIATLVLIFVTLHKWAQKKKVAGVTQTESDLYAVILAILLSLLVTGAGFLALDLPL